MLNTITYGEPNDLPPILIAHGLFGSARNWGVIARRLAATRQVLVVDMRNHGDSFRAESQTYPDMAGDLAEVIEAQPGAVADVVGHSMGGKAAMVLALTRPELIRRLIVADIAPVGYTHTQTHNIDAMRRVDLAAISSRAEAMEQLGIDNAGVAAFLLQSLDLKARRWKLNFDVLERDMAAIIGFPELDGEFEKPTLFLSGALSDYVLPEHRDRIQSPIFKGEICEVAEVGHWLHAERPREFEAAVAHFLG